MRSDHIINGAPEQGFVSVVCHLILFSVVCAMAGAIIGLGLFA